MGKVEYSNGPSKWPSRTFVLIQGFILLLLIFTHFEVGVRTKQFVSVGSPFEWLGILGILVSARSLGSALTAMPLPKREGEMTSRGLYRYVRHPMYSSVLLFSLGIAINYGDLYKYLLVGSLYILFYFKSSYEEKLLASTYPEYANYAKNTPRFIPTFTRKKNL